MEKSIWQNRGLFTLSVLTLTEFGILSNHYKENEWMIVSIMRAIVILVAIVLLVLQFIRAFKSRNKYNYIYSNPQYIRVGVDECLVKKNHDKYNVHYIVCYKCVINEKNYEFTDKFMINTKKEKEFDTLLHYQAQIEFVYLKDNPCYHILEKSDTLKKLDIIDSKYGWRNDKLAFFVVVAELVYCIYAIKAWFF